MSGGLSVSVALNLRYLSLLKKKGGRAHKIESTFDTATAKVCV